jgi:hypothetical protein
LGSSSWFWAWPELWEKAVQRAHDAHCHQRDAAAGCDADYHGVA